MNHALRTWVVPLIVTLSVAGVLAWQYRVTTELRHQLEREQKSLVDRAPLHPGDGSDMVAAEARHRVESSIKDEDEAALARLRNEIAELKERAAARAQRKTNLATAPAKERSITEEMLPATEWTEAGAASPTSTLETALWAASVGDVDALAGLLSIDPVVRTQLNGLLMRLPDGIRREYDTAERLVALLTAPDVPLGEARIYDFKRVDLRGTGLTAVVRDAGNRTRVANLTLRQEGDEWKLVVPAEAVGRYEAMLKATERP